tara:strand:- start:389 stop:568 length:180 start_codon:yes stop_codon:yes gene_type:complete
MEGNVLFCVKIFPKVKKGFPSSVPKGKKKLPVLCPQRKKKYDDGKSNPGHWHGRRVFYH